MSPLGVQLLADLHACDAAVLDDVEAVRAAMLEAARRAGATIVSECFHRFSPHGVSGVVVIAESHLAVHTWPEHGFAAVDLFTCADDLRSDHCIAWLVEAFGCGRHTTTRVERGRLPAP